MSDVVTLAHGAGGKATRDLVEGLFLPELANDLLAPLADAAVLSGGLAFTTDAYVVRPLVFPGGDIGELAVNGTVNDLACAGALPLALAAGFVLEEGFPLDDLRAIAASMARAAERAGVPVAAGDTKVVERGHGDGLYVTTAGVGAVHPDADLGPGRVRPGDAILLSGTIADHGMAVMVARGELELEAEIDSDTAPVHRLVQSLLRRGAATRWLRDPTRGGVATALNELARSAGLNVVLDEPAIPIRPPVRAACEVLGIDPLYVANEGKLLAVVEPAFAEEAVASLGPDAAVVGEIADNDSNGLVVMRTALGGRRLVDVLVGDPLPRIC